MPISKDPVGSLDSHSYLVEQRGPITLQWSGMEKEKSQVEFWDFHPCIVVMKEKNRTISLLNMIQKSLKNILANTNI